MAESKENIPQRPSLLKGSKALLQFANNADPSQRLRSKSVTFNKAVMLNLMQQSSEEDDEEISFEKEIEIIVKFNMEKVYFLMTNTYLDDTIISSSDSSQCMELDIDSATNFDHFDVAPKKSFLIPAGMMEKQQSENGSDEIGDIPLDSITSLEEKQPVLLSVQPIVTTVEEQKDPFMKELETFSENEKIDRFEAKSLNYIESCFNEFSQYCRNNNCEIINSTTYSITMRMYPPVFFKWLLCCTHNKGGLVVRFQNEPGRKLLRLVSISGNTSKFLDIRNRIKCRLWSKGLIMLPETDALVAAVEMKNARIKQLKEQIHELRKNLKNQTVLQLILNKIITIREQLFNTITHNYTGSAKPQNMIDKPLYIDLLLDIYKQYTKTDQEIYTAKRKKIVESWSIEQCFQYLQIEDRYRLKQNQQNDIPYSKAIHEFQRLNYALSPLDKLNCINKGYQAMKQCCQSSKLQLQTMDTILPLLIYIILRSDIQNICANIKIVQNFINIKQQYKTADKMVTNVFVATQYIAVSWEFAKKSSQ